MNWQLHIADRRKYGWTLTTIAAAVGTSVSTISELARGTSREPRWGLGAAIIALPKQPAAARSAAAPAKREVA